MGSSQRPHTESAPLPRPVRAPVTGFSIPWRDLRDATAHFWMLLDEARARPATVPREELLDMSDPRNQGAWHWQTYALAVQVFAAMTAEAALNTYGLIRFGQQQFEQRRFAWRGPVTRLRRMMELGAGVALDDSHNVIRLLERLTAKRNPIVHMRAKEDVFDESGRVIRPAPRPPDYLADARAAVEEMEAFLRGFAELIAQHDPWNATYVAPL